MVSSSYSNLRSLKASVARLAATLYDQFETEGLFPEKQVNLDFDSLLETEKEKLLTSLSQIQSGNYSRDFQLEVIESRLSHMIRGLKKDYPVDYTIAFLVSYKNDVETINHLISYLNCSESITRLISQLETTLSRLIRGYSQIYNQ
ncbi:MAG: hypothetical protein ACW98F_07305 [Candidatus Hodarchaeales archaeon]|jgi:hypothetical protein